MDSLQILKLDNNYIKKIENLGELSQLRSLDLSFNEIEKIENLDKLVNLEDLSLYHNKIKEVHFEDIQNLRKLNLLSLSHNELSDIMSLIKSLSPMENLQVLTIANNPLTKEPDYKQYLYKNLTQLKYLDYALIDDKDRQDTNSQMYQSEFALTGEGNK